MFLKKLIFGKTAAKFTANAVQIYSKSLPLEEFFMDFDKSRRRTTLVTRVNQIRWHRSSCCSRVGL